MWSLGLFPAEFLPYGMMTVKWPVIRCFAEISATGQNININKVSFLYKLIDDQIFFHPPIDMAAALPPLQPVTPPTSQAALPTLLSNKGCPLMYAAWNGPDIQDSMMDMCTARFSSNYGVWGPKVPQRQGKHIKMTGACLRAQCLETLSDHFSDMLPAEWAGWPCICDRLGYPCG